MRNIPPQISTGVGFGPSNQDPSDNPNDYSTGLRIEKPGTILFYPDSQYPTFIGVNAKKNANPYALDWKIYKITYNPANPNYFTSVVVSQGAWANEGA